MQSMLPEQVWLVLANVVPRVASVFVLITLVLAGATLLFAVSRIAIAVAGRVRTHLSARTDGSNDPARPTAGVRSARGERNNSYPDADHGPTPASSAGRAETVTLAFGQQWIYVRSPERFVLTARRG